MWSDCPQVLDKPVTKWGFELDDLLLLGAIASVSFIIIPPLVWLVTTPALFAGAYYGKRGKPPGAIPHWLQEQEWVPWYDLSLPGCIPAAEQTYTFW